jgi:hypothetical protein
MSAHRKTLFCILTICLSGTTSQAARPGISHLADTEIFGDVILLSHMVPRAAALSVYPPAEGVVPTVSPQRGTSCAVGGAGESAGQEKTAAANITSRISAKRMERLVTREEVFDAIQAFLATPQNSSLPFHAQDIHLGPAVWVPVKEALLAVTQNKFDPLTGCNWFRLRSGALPELLPFYASICTTRLIEKKSSLPQIAFARLTSAPHGSEDSSPFLVEPGHPARLLVSSPDSQMILLVHPLQRGRLGESVRVRLEGSVKTLTGQVTGLAHLEQTY